MVELSAYLRAAKQAGMSEAEMAAAIEVLAASPEAGDLIPGTGGCRKVRLAGRGKGKSGGYRLISFYGGPDMPVFLVTVFGKGEKADLTQGERNALAAMSERLMESYPKGIVKPR